MNRTFLLFQSPPFCIFKVRLSDKKIKVFLPRIRTSSGTEKLAPETFLSLLDFSCEVTKFLKNCLCFKVWFRQYAGPTLKYLYFVFHFTFESDFFSPSEMILNFTESSTANPTYLCHFSTHSRQALLVCLYKSLCTVLCPMSSGLILALPLLQSFSQSMDLKDIFHHKLTIFKMLCSQQEFVFLLLSKAKLKFRQKTSLPFFSKLV